jgi:predicted regulator of Ras-like GTPase activity (Roadblock/LC7/MglB family)
MDDIAGEMVLMAGSSSLMRGAGEETARIPVQGLDHFLKFNGVLDALLILSDGTLVARAGYLDADTDGLLGSIALLIAESGSIAGRIRNGAHTMIFLEFKHKFLMIQEMDHDQFIVIVGRADANIGQISYQLRKEWRLKAGSGI